HFTRHHAAESLPATFAPRQRHPYLTPNNNKEGCPLATMDDLERVITTLKLFGEASVQVQSVTLEPASYDRVWKTLERNIKIFGAAAPDERTKLEFEFCGIRFKRGRETQRRSEGIGPPPKVRLGTIA